MALNDEGVHTTCHAEASAVDGAHIARLLFVCTQSDDRPRPVPRDYDRTPQLPRPRPGARHRRALCVPEVSTRRGTLTESTLIIATSSGA